MARKVDPLERRLEVTSAAMRIIARGGLGALTLRSLAEELNGSITLVTHFFAKRSDLFEAIVDDLIASYDAEMIELEQCSDEYARLETLLKWLLPLDEEELEREATRIALNSMREESSIDHFYVAMEKRTRQLMSVYLEPLLPAAEVPAAVDVLRATVNGLVLSAVEHPQLWPSERQLSVLYNALRGLGVRQSDAVTT
ncbi:hypothetical protein GCM10027416_11570 [Okibacterium endophyticum]